MVCEYLPTFLCVVIASASAYIHTTVDMTGPFISKQSASSFIMPTRRFEDTQTCYNQDGEMICPIENYQRQTVYTREFYLEEPLFHKVDTHPVITTADEKAGEGEGQTVQNEDTGKAPSPEAEKPEEQTTAEDDGNQQEVTEEPAQAQQEEEPAQETDSGNQGTAQEAD